MTNQDPDSHAINLLNFALTSFGHNDLPSGQYLTRHNHQIEDSMPPHCLNSWGFVSLTSTAYSGKQDKTKLFSFQLI